MKRHFDDELCELKAEIVKMAALSVEAIRESVEALKARDSQLAQKVIDGDVIIDRLELEIDAKGIDLIARFQPMAKDLRLISMAMRINAELERIADMAVDIAQRTLELVKEPILKPLIDIPKLTIIAQDMVRMSIDSFVNGDVKLAREVLELEPQADALRDEVQRELIEDYMAKDASTAPRAVQLLLVARFLERICDHATNIVEEVIFMVEGTVLKHASADGPK